MAHLAVGVARCVSVFHRLGFIIKDLHPGNVVLHDSDIFFIDLGLIRPINRIDSKDSIYGRLNYLPPEVFEGHNPDQKSDIYCLGTIIWQLMTGISPQGNSLNSAKAHPDSLREDLVPGIPYEYEQILRHCWNLNPNKRPTISQVCADLEVAYSAMQSIMVSAETLSYVEARKEKRDQELLNSASSSLTSGVYISRFYEVKEA